VSHVSSGAGKGLHLSLTAVRGRSGGASDDQTR
jgi:hypothetical protein